MKMKSSKAVSLFEVEKILTKRGEEGELGYEQTMALEHAKKFCKHDSKKAQTILSSLTKNEKITEAIALKIINIMPKDTATLKAILAKDKIEMSEEELAQIIKELA